ncbi:MAG: amidohydrolase family protein, partial [Desulfurococcales archaeon]|nr:amidohydrolase family protein [Desulfurococcales archaeon]
EHASVIRPDQVAKASELGVSIAIQPHFVISDWWVVDRVGAERAPWVYPFKSIIGAGLTTGFSTDAPVEPVNPWDTVYAAVTRGTYEGVKLSELSKDQVLDVATALYCYTYGSAQLMHSENEVGSLDVGKYADLIIVDRDPLEANPRELRTIKVLGTVVGGEFVYVSSELPVCVHQGK